MAMMRKKVAKQAAVIAPLIALFWEEVDFEEKTIWCVQYDLNIKI